MKELRFIQERCCTCQYCKQACSLGNPGWFGPGQAEKAAEYLGMDWDDFRSRYLIQDYWCGGAYVWAPRKVASELSETWARRELDNNIGREVATFGYGSAPGRCLFHTDEGLCRIHPVKPIECSSIACCSPLAPRYPDEINREQINDMWAEAGFPLGRAE